MEPFDFEALQKEVTKRKSVPESMSIVLSALLAEVETHKKNQFAIQAIVDRFRAGNYQLAENVVANTPHGRAVDTGRDDPNDPDLARGPHGSNGAQVSRGEQQARR